MKKEYLDLLIEECAEVIQAATKIKRFGPENWHPLTPDITNEDHLAQEIGGLQEVVERLELRTSEIVAGQFQKTDNLRIYGPDAMKERSK